MKTKFTILPLFVSILAFSQIPDHYYDGTTGLTGYALKTKLSQIISQGHRDLGYGGLWETYKTSDIDNYYEKDGTILDIYSENPNGKDPYNFKVASGQCGNYGGEGDCYNREHIVPQRLFKKANPMHNDAHFIVPTDGKVNGMRGDYPFGEVKNPSYTSGNGSKLGNNTTNGYSGTVFEPIDEFKGDVARMVLYFVTRYEDKIPTFDSGNMFNGTRTQSLEKWELDVLLKWAAQDPVSQKEIDRNNAVYARQGNRNPFIDHQEWVNQIWGNPTEATPTPIPPSPTPLPTPTPPATSTSCGTEDFENIGAKESSYEKRTWTNNNITWTATDSRTDQIINGKALTIGRKDGSLSSSTISGGIASFTITLKRVFGRKNGKIDLYINGDNKGAINFTENQSTQTIQNINVDGDIKIELKNNSGERVTVDDLSWTCFNDLSVNEVNTTNSIKIYPNPIKNREFYISDVKEGEIVKIFNMNGQLIQTDRVGYKGFVKLKSSLKGVFLVSIQAKTIKIIVE